MRAITGSYVETIRIPVLPYTNKNDGKNLSALLAHCSYYTLTYVAFDA
jgi:hypothetical protein